MYSLLAITIGPKGIWAMNQLIRESERINQNLDELQEIHTSLNEHVWNLTANPDTIAVFAHELGYVTEGEKLIKLAGFKGGINRFFATGTALNVKKPEYIPDWTCKTIAGLAGVCSFFLQALLRRRKKA